jgi:hypothetical protein
MWCALSAEAENSMGRGGMAMLLGYSSLQMNFCSFCGQKIKGKKECGAIAAAHRSTQRNP